MPVATTASRPISFILPRDLVFEPTVSLVDGDQSDSTKGAEAGMNKMTRTEGEGLRQVVVMCQANGSEVAEGRRRTAPGSTRDQSIPSPVNGIARTRGDSAEGVTPKISGQGHVFTGQNIDEPANGKDKEALSAPVVNGATLVAPGSCAASSVSVVACTSPAGIPPSATPPSELGAEQTLRSANVLSIRSIPCESTSPPLADPSLSDSVVLAHPLHLSGGSPTGDERDSTLTSSARFHFNSLLTHVSTLEQANASLQASNTSLLAQVAQLQAEREAQDGESMRLIADAQVEARRLPMAVQALVTLLTLTDRLVELGNLRADVSCVEDDEAVEALWDFLDTAALASCEISRGIDSQTGVARLSTVWKALPPVVEAFEAVLDRIGETGEVLHEKAAEWVQDMWAFIADWRP